MCHQFYYDRSDTCASFKNAICKFVHEQIERWQIYRRDWEDDYQWLLPKECKNITEWDEGEQSSHLQPSKE